MDSVDKKVKNVVAEGGKILTGGKALKTKGYFYEPTIIEVEKVMYEEFFAPVILIKSFKDRKEIEQIIENNPTGLVTQIWAKDLDKAKKIAKTFSFWFLALFISLFKSISVKSFEL